MEQKTEPFRDLYVMLSPGQNSLSIVCGNDGPEGFCRFVDKQTGRAMNDPLVPDNWLLHYSLPSDLIWQVPKLAARPSRDYFSAVIPGLTEHGVYPANIVRLRDAVFCREKNISLAGPEVLSQ